jgi:hypothetical protein
LRLRTSMIEVKDVGVEVEVKDVGVEVEVEDAWE